VRQPWRAHEGRDHRKVAAPQLALRVERTLARFGARQLPARAFALPARQVFETRERDLVGLALTAEVLAERRALPCRAAGFREQRELERREVAVTDEPQAAVDRLRDALVVDARKDAREPVAAARDQGDVGVAGRRAMDA